VGAGRGGARQVSCRNLSAQVAIDVGLRNPPADGPTDPGRVPYGVWCSGDLVEGRARHGQEAGPGGGCIEMRYMGAYMAWCAQAWDPAWAAYYRDNP
jgi:hypothetical protein